MSQADLTQGIPLWIHGISGRMGTEIKQRLAAGPNRSQPFALAGGSGFKLEDPQGNEGEAVTSAVLAQALTRTATEVILDFSAPDANRVLLEAVDTIQTKRLAVLIGTTGLTAPALADWRALAARRDCRVLIAPNTSIGVLLLAKVAALAVGNAAGLGFDVEIVETHHRAKQDAPSGTAKFLAETTAAAAPGLRPVFDRRGARQAGEIGIHAVRGGGVFGEHEVRIIGDAEEICLSHRAFSRALFAGGALALIRWLREQTSGCYGLLDVDLSAVR